MRQIFDKTSIIGSDNKLLFTTLGGGGDYFHTFHIIKFRLLLGRHNCIIERQEVSSSEYLVCKASLQVHYEFFLALQNMHF